MAPPLPHASLQISLAFDALLRIAQVVKRTVSQTVLRCLHPGCGLTVPRTPISDKLGSRRRPPLHTAHSTANDEQRCTGPVLS